MRLRRSGRDRGHDDEPACHLRRLDLRDEPFGEQERRESAGPNVRIVSIRQRMMKPKSPKVSWKITPW